MSTPYPTVVPMLAYADGRKALEWLPTAFGCTVGETYVGDDGRIGHAELWFDDGLVTFAEFEPPYQGPAELKRNYPPAGQWLDTPYIVNGVLIAVDDVDAHHEQAKAAGAVILSEPEDSGHGRIYRVADFEGQRWMFNQRR